MTRLRFVVLISVLFLLGCASPTSRSGRVRLDERSKAVLAEATKVEVFRIDPEHGPYGSDPPQAGDRTVGGYLIMSQGPDQGKEFASKLAAGLSDENNYEVNAVKCFLPGVAFRAWKGE